MALPCGSDTFATDMTALLVTFAALWARQIDGWTLCNSTWMVRVLAANDVDLMQKNVVWQGWLISCSRGLM